jgi:hypothetical protein
MTTREHGLRFVERCPHRQTTILGRTGPLGNPTREKRCLECGRTLDIREVGADA